LTDVGSLECLMPGPKGKKKRKREGEGWITLAILMYCMQSGGKKGKKIKKKKKRKKGQGRFRPLGPVIGGFARKKLRGKKGKDVRGGGGGRGKKTRKNFPSALAEPGP